SSRRNVMERFVALRREIWKSDLLRLFDALAAVRQTIGISEHLMRGIRAETATPAQTWMHGQTDSMVVRSGRGFGALDGECVTTPYARLESASQIVFQQASPSRSGFGSNGRAQVGKRFCVAVVVCGSVGDLCGINPVQGGDCRRLI